MLPADFVTFPQVARTARAKATSLVREKRAKMGDLKGKVAHAIVRLRVLAYEKHAASPVARLAAPWYRRPSHSGFYKQNQARNRIFFLHSGCGPI